MRKFAKLLFHKRIDSEPQAQTQIRIGHCARTLIGTVAGNERPTIADYGIVMFVCVMT